MSVVVEEIRQFLPLSVCGVEIDADGICLNGDRWRLHINTNWRNTLDGSVVLSPSFPWKGSVARGLYDLVGDDIVEVRVQSCEVGLDLGMVSRTRKVLEILSDFPYGEWTLSIWSPGDARKISIFDLEAQFRPDGDWVKFSKLNRGKCSPDRFVR